jgi:hypothetical protein
MQLNFAKTSELRADRHDARYTPRGEIHAKFQSLNLRRKGHLETLGVTGGLYEDCGLVSVVSEWGPVTGASVFVKDREFPRANNKKW